MSTKFLSPGWRMPRNANQSKSANYSLDFDSTTSDYIDIPETIAIRPLSAKMSLSAWFKISGGSGDRTIFAVGISGGYAVDYQLKVDTNNNLSFRVRNTSGSPYYATITGGTSLNTDQWYHACVTWDAANINLYLNGQTDATQVAATTFYYTGSASLPGIGSQRGATNGHINLWAGCLSQICYFDYALSASQVTTLWGGGTSVSNPMALPSPPIAYYPLGTSAWNGQYLAENNAIGDYVFDFDGSDKINCGIANTYNEFCLSAWIKKDSTAPNYAGIFGTRNSTAVQFPYLLSLDNTGKVRLIAGGNTAILSNSAINNDTWYHIVGLGDGNNLKLYINGQLQTATSTYTTQSANNHLMIGGQYDVDSQFLWVGEISNAQIWDTSLLSTEVQTLYNYGSPIQTLANIPQSSNLKAWYKLDASEVYNNTTTEWSVDNNQNPSAYSSSLDFDSASSDYIQIPYNVNLTPQNGNFTISAWINTGNLSGWHPIWCTQNLSSTVPVVALHTFGNKVRATVGGSTNNPSYGGGWALLLDSTQSLTTSTWYHIAVSYDMSGNAQIYINGNPDNSGPIENPQTSWTTGDRFIGEGEGYWDGRISNMSVWNAALTSTQVTELYNSGTPSNLSSHSATSNLVSWWKLNNTTTGIEDAKGSNNGTNNGATEYPGFVNTLVGNSSGMSQANLVQSDLQTVAPYSKYAMDFDSASSDYIDCGDSDDFSFGDGSTDSPFSVSAWVNFNSASTSVGIIAKYAGTNATREWMVYTSPQNFRLLLQDESYNNFATATSTTIQTNKWYNIVATYDGRGGSNANLGINIYINGQLQTLSYTGSSSYFAMNNTNAAVRIGRYSTGNYFDGSISNALIWNTALTSAQVTEIYNEGLPGNLNSHSAYSNLVSWWQLGENSSFDGNDWIVADEKGTNNGTSVSMPVGALTNGVGTTANGVSNAMSESNLVGDAPYSTANAISTNMVVTSRVSGSGNTP